MEAVLLALIFSAIALTQAFFLSRFGLRGFTYKRAFSRDAAFAGETVELIEVIGNKKPLFIPWLRLETRVSPALKFSTSEEMDVRGQRYHKSVFTLAPYRMVTRRHKVTLSKRGHYRLENAALTMGDLLGMHPVTKEMAAVAEIYVYPRLLDEGAGDLPSMRWQGEAIAKRWIMPDAFLVNGIRAYRAGDAPGDIHWAATARMGELQVKTHDFTADPKLMVIINAQKAESQWGDLMEYEQEAIEYAISLAATLCVNALRAGVEAGFAANMPLEESGECAFFPPARGAGREEELLRAFACLRVLRSRSFPTFLDDLRGLTGMDILILSCYESDMIAQRAEQLRRMGNSVSVRLLPRGEGAA